MISICRLGSFTAFPPACRILLIRQDKPSKHAQGFLHFPFWNLQSGSFNGHHQQIDQLLKGPAWATACLQSKGTRAMRRFSVWQARFLLVSLLEFIHIQSSKLGNPNPIPAFARGSYLLSEALRFLVSKNLGGSPKGL